MSGSGESEYRNGQEGQKVGSGQNKTILYWKTKGQGMSVLLWGGRVKTHLESFSKYGERMAVMTPEQQTGKMTRTRQSGWLCACWHLTGRVLEKTEADVCTEEEEEGAIMHHASCQRQSAGWSKCSPWYSISV